jgi:glycosyltransferase involved in cell wall biosynthesis
MKIPEHPGIHYLGFVSEEDKFDAVAGAVALWLPSQFESLSISVLEAMSLSVPVLVNGKCEVLKGHCQKSGGGFAYTDYEECEKALSCLVKDETKRDRMGKNAYDYIEQNYLWDKIMRKIKTIIEGI